MCSGGDYEVQQVAPAPTAVTPSDAGSSTSAARKTTNSQRNKKSSKTNMLASGGSSNSLASMAMDTHSSLG